MRIVMRVVFIDDDRYLQMRIVMRVIFIDEDSDESDIYR